MQGDPQLFRGFLAGESLKIVAESAFPIFSGQKGKLPAQPGKLLLSVLFQGQVLRVLPI